MHDAAGITNLFLNDGVAYRENQEYADAEIYARENKLGLWNLPNPIPSWNRRKK
jgi:endonuclease YncB( thermonuclease family)